MRGFNSTTEQREVMLRRGAAKCSPIQASDERDGDARSTSTGCFRFNSDNQFPNNSPKVDMPKPLFFGETLNGKLRQIMGPDNRAVGRFLNFANGGFSVSRSSGYFSIYP